MSGTCPACGVAVVPGYVRCPKCQRPLPGGRRVQTVAGGTAVEGRDRLPILPIAGGAIVVLGIILYFVLGKSDAAKPAGPDPATAGSAEEVVDETPAATNTAPIPLPRDDDRDNNNRVDPRVVAHDVERALKNQRLWSTVEVIGSDVEVTSGSCRDPNMIPVLDAASGALRNAGLTRVRCMENSGAVVFERRL